MRTPFVMQPVLGVLAWAWSDNLGLVWARNHIHAWIGIAVPLHSKRGREAVAAVGVLAGFGDYAHGSEVFEKSSYLH